MIASVPASAPHGPPETGASISVAPLGGQRAPTSRTVAGPIVLMSMTSFPLPCPASHAVGAADDFAHLRIGRDDRDDDLGVPRNFGGRGARVARRRR